VKILVKGADSVFAELSKQILKAHKSVLEKEAIKLAKHIADATPIDTGEAMRGWKTADINGEVTILNEVPYIAILNQGHSQQAPAHFVEKVLLQYGKPVGALVTTTPD
jgi:fumarate hydratase class II